MTKGCSVRIGKFIPVVELQWHDAVSHDPWGSKSDPPLPLVVSYGLLVHQDSKKIVIARSIAVNNAEDPLEGTLAVPRGWIVSMKRIANSEIPSNIKVKSAS